MLVKLSIEVKAPWGSNIWDVSEEMYQLAKVLNVTVTCNFNGVEIYCDSELDKTFAAMMYRSTELSAKYDPQSIDSKKGKNNV